MNPVAERVVDQLRQIATNHPPLTESLMFADASYTAAEQIDAGTLSRTKRQIIVAVYQLNYPSSVAFAEYVHYLYPTFSGVRDVVFRTPERQPLALTFNFEDNRAFFDGTLMTVVENLPPTLTVAYGLREYRPQDVRPPLPPFVRF